MYYNRRKCKKQFWSASIRMLALGAFCMSVFPIPVPQVELDKSLGEQRFACQSRGCGCRTAQQCWTSCCCFTPSQRIAWAKENGVVPPGYAVVDEPQSKPEQAAPKKSCCAGKTVASGVSAKQPKKRVKAWAACTLQTEPMALLCRLLPL